jgi:hypothetical protein
MIMEMITNVLGFDYDLELTDRRGELVRTGIQSTCNPETDEVPNIGNNYGNVRWFTNFNESLLNQVRDYKKQNT